MGVERKPALPNRADGEQMRLFMPGATAHVAVRDVNVDRLRIDADIDGVAIADHEVSRHRTVFAFTILVVHALLVLGWNLLALLEDVHNVFPVPAGADYDLDLGLPVRLNNVAQVQDARAGRVRERPGS